MVQPAEDETREGEEDEGDEHSGNEDDEVEPIVRGWLVKGKVLSVQREKTCLKPHSHHNTHLANRKQDAQETVDDARHSPADI